MSGENEAPKTGTNPPIITEDDVSMEFGRLHLVILKLQRQLDWALKQLAAARPGGSGPPEPPEKLN